MQREKWLWAGRLKPRFRKPADTTTQAQIATPPDLFLPLNRVMFGRVMFGVNEGVVDSVINPTAWGLGTVTPGFDVAHKGVPT